MKTRSIVGKRIKRIRQHKTGRECHIPGTWVVTAIELEDGTLLRPCVIEGEADYFVEFVVVKP